MSSSSRLRIGVVGGSGFIGSHLVAELVREGNEVVVLDLQEPPSPKCDRAEFVRCDVRHAKTLEGSLDGFDVLIVLAGILAKGCRENPRNGWDTNVNGFVNVLEEVVRSGNSPLILYPSTAMVYASYGQSYPLHETGITEVGEVYGGSKLSCETLLRTACIAHGFRGFVLRLFTVYGSGSMSGLKGHFVGTWLDQVKQGRPLTLFGDGQQTVDLVHVEDVVQAFKACLETELHSRECEIINIGGGYETSVEQVARWVSEVVPGVERTRLPGEPCPSQRRWADIGLAKRKLGYHPSIQPRDGIQQLFGQIIADRLENV